MKKPLELQSWNDLHSRSSSHGMPLLAILSVGKVKHRRVRISVDQAWRAPVHLNLRK